MLKSYLTPKLNDGHLYLLSLFNVTAQEIEPAVLKEIPPLCIEQAFMSKCI